MHAPQETPDCNCDATGALPCSALLGVECPACKERCRDEMDLVVHVYIEHPALNDSISKMQRGEPYMTADELRREGKL